VDVFHRAWYAQLRRVLKPDHVFVLGQDEVHVYRMTACLRLIWPNAGEGARVRDVALIGPVVIRPDWMPPVLEAYLNAWMQTLSAGRKPPES
jgi:hypothetical protein